MCKSLRNFKSHRSIYRHVERLSQCGKERLNRVSARLGDSVRAARRICEELHGDCRIEYLAAGASLLFSARVSQYCPEFWASLAFSDILVRTGHRCLHETIGEQVAAVANAILQECDPIPTLSAIESLDGNRRTIKFLQISLSSWQRIKTSLGQFESVIPMSAAIGTLASEYSAAQDLVHNAKVTFDVHEEFSPMPCTVCSSDCKVVRIRHSWRDQKVVTVRTIECKSDKSHHRKETVDRPITLSSEHLARLDTAT